MRKKVRASRVGAIEGVKTCLLGSWDNPCAPDLPVPMMNRLKLRKGNGTRACRDKAQTVEAIVGRAGQHKTRMVKAILPEPQSPGRYPPQRRSDGCNAVPCRSRDATRPGLKRAMLVGALGPASTACLSLKGSKGRTGHLSASHLLNTQPRDRLNGRLSRRPARRQSRHNSQTPGVMAGTALPRRDDRE